MNKVKRYTKEEALKIINADKDLKADYKEFKPFVGTEELDVGFEYGNFFSLYDSKADVIDPEKIVIQWLDSGYADDGDEFDFDKHAHEVIADNIEEALVILRDIEEADGNLE